MSDQTGYTGGCQCGAVTYTIAGNLPPAYACHCGECKKQSASAFSLSIAVAFSRLEVTGELSMFESEAFSGAVKRCYFCAACGTRLWHRSTNYPDSATLKVGTIDKAQHIAPVFHLWVSKKQAGFKFDPGAKTYDTQPENLAELREAMSK